MAESGVESNINFTRFQRDSTRILHIFFTMIPRFHIYNVLDSTLGIAPKPILAIPTNHLKFSSTHAWYPSHRALLFFQSHHFFCLYRHRNRALLRPHIVAIITRLVKILRIKRQNLALCERGIKRNKIATKLI